MSMIVRGEEECLPACLASVAGADELVVVDTSLPDDPPDRTREIALAHGAKLFEFPWCDDFSKARNVSLSHCTGGWVLVIDADEVLEGGIETVREVIANIPEGVLGVQVLCKADSGGEAHWSLRLFRRGQAVWKGAVHNYLTLDMSRCPTSSLIVRYGYSPAHKKDPDRALRILSKELERDPRLVREAYYLAREYWYRKDYAAALAWYENYLKKATWAPEMADAWLMAARCLWNLRKGNEARDCCLQAIKINADFKEAFLLMAEMSWPKNAACWRRVAEVATNQDVLFIRTP